MTDPTMQRLSAALEERYSVEAAIGVGGMATVYLARDLRHKRRVAIKVLHSDVSQALGEERFHREIEIVATLTHPNILPLHDSGEADGMRYYVMPYIEGESLAERLDREGQLALDTAVKIAQQVARALEHAHGRGVVHRDIKPANILLVGDQALVADFGIARLAGSIEATPLTTAGLSVGTPHYMSPEQSQAREVDGRADIYSLGCVLYEMIAGEPPFTGKTAHAVMARHAVDPLPPLRTVRETVSEDLEAIVTKAAAKVPADRFRSAAEMAAALEVARAPASSGRRRRGGHRVPRKVVASVAGVGAVAALALWGPRPGRPPVEVPLDPQLIAVAPFRVTATGGEAFDDLADGIPELMYLGLAGERGPRAVYPGTAGPVWERAAADGALGDSAAVSAARLLGAGRLVLGHAFFRDTLVSLDATLLDAGNGRVVATGSAAGSVNDLLPLIDELTVELLIRDAGEAEDRVAAFTQTDLEAVRAYLAGQAAFHESRFSEAAEHFARALALDSTFAMAGVQLLVVDSYSLNSALQGLGQRAADAGRARLSPRDRVLLDAFTSGVGSVEERVAMWDSAALLMPDRKTVQFLRADYLFHYGDAMGRPGSMEMAEAGFRRVRELDPQHVPALAHLFELAAVSTDTARALQLGRLLVAQEASEYLPYYRWRLDLVEGTASTERFSEAVGEMDTGSIERVVGSAQIDGYDVGYAVIAVEHWSQVTTEIRYALHAARRLHLNRGRPAAARVARDRLLSLGPEKYDALIDVFDALFWGADSTAARTAVRLRPHVDERRPPMSTTLAESPHWVDACAVGLWRVATGDPSGAERASAALAGYVAELEGGDRRGTETCALVIDAQLAQGSGRADLERLILRLDRTARAQPFMARELQVASRLVLARILERRGDLEGALSVYRRRVYSASGDTQALSTFLREEARLAGALGQTERAIRASRLYLSLREDPEPDLQGEADAVRERLREMTGG